MARLLSILVALAAAGQAGLAGDSTDQVGQVEHGRDLYRIYCRNCHGETGLGDGPMAEVLTVRPKDLTRLSRDHGGEFPTDDVYSTIDGRDEVLPHGANRMPVWGLAFQQFDTDVDQERQVQARILQLLEYLKSIQTPASGKK